MTDHAAGEAAVPANAREGPADRLAAHAVPIPGDVAPDVVGRARSGDDRAFAQLVEHYDPALRRLVHVLFRDVDQIDRLLADAYVKAYRALPRFGGTAKPGVWLYRIVYGTCVDELRRQFHRPMTTGGTQAAPVDRTMSSFETALGGLPADLRALVVMIDGDEFAHAGAAEVLGLDAAAVATRLARARGALRQALSQQALAVDDVASPTGGDVSPPTATGDAGPPGEEPPSTATTTDATSRLELGESPARGAIPSAAQTS